MTAKSSRYRVRLLALVVLLSLSPDFQGQLGACSSYLDDYFLPQAKLALNKIQQSLSPTSNFVANQQPQLHITESFNQNQTTSNPTSASIATASSSEVDSTSSTLATQSPVQDPETSRANDYVVDTTRANNQYSSVEYAANQQPETGGERQAALPVDVATAASGSTSAEPATDSAPATEAAPTEPDVRAKPETSTEGQEGMRPGPVVVVVESNEAAIKETELEAVAAVDASIGFGDIFGGGGGAGVGTSSLGDSCYDEYANARYCEPEFENIAFERQVEVSSECGTPPNRFCTAYLNERHEQIRNCHICDAQHPKKRHPAAYLTDLNNSNSPTCWVSAPISAGSSGNSSVPQQQPPLAEGGGKLAGDNVTLVLNLDKKYEIVYLSLQFCSMKPDSLAIYKSSDYGRTYTPYQFYSSQCRRMYNRPASARSGLVAGAHGQLEAACTNSSAGQAGPTSASSGGASGRIAFSTLDGRSGHSLDRSQQLQDWITATNIKIVLDRHQASWIHSNLVHPHAHYLHQHHPTAAPPPLQQQPARNGSEPEVNTQAAGDASLPESSLTSPSDTFNYAMSDLIVGGQCKCNGHASRCIHSKDASRLQCDCRHNTAGRDCEKCAPFHFDRPWARATQLDANPCQPCNCNGHSRKCRFDAELYRMSGKRSGGVCIGCRDNTAGRFCNYCKEGFTRDHSKPMSDKEACKHCDCHPIGSLGRACNQTTGQCPCKEGVSGLQCNRCAPGYQQSSSLTDPCIKIPDNENDINYYPPLAVDGDDQSASAEVSIQNPAPLDPGTPGEEGATQETIAPSDGHSSGRPRPIQPPPELDQQLPAGPTNQDQIATNQVLDVGRQPEVNPQDKDDDTSDSGDQPTDQTAPPPPPSYVRKQSSRARPSSHWQQQQQPRKPAVASYYGYHPATGGGRARHQQQAQFEPALDEDELIGGDEELDELPRLRRPPNGAEPDADYPSRGYYYNLYGGKRYGPEYGTTNRKHRLHATPATRHRADLLPVASLEHGGDEMNSLEEATSGGYPMHPIYSPADDSFNQIQTPMRSRQLASSKWSRAHSAPAPVGQQRLKPLAQYPSLLMGTGSHQQQQQSGMMSEVVCGECQSSTRRLSSRQFCHLQFAIRATILNKYMADDWTKFEVEIQDIFKSQPASASEPSSLAQTPAPSADNMLQADEPVMRVDNATGSADALLDAATGAGSSAGHRIKVGTVQSIWVPTEDLGCRCPRLKPRATYLLMGSIDAKENSANALQLDRHGVALEWKSSLQEKMLRYQRRQSRGKC